MQKSEVQCPKVYYSLLYGQSITYNGMFMYIKLSNEIKSVTCIMKFKKILINFLLENNFYSGEEFVTIEP